jgi:CRP/FNR family transcriptional regulator, cyclic AMP receptor protein
MDETRLGAIPLFSGLAKKDRRRVAQQADEVDIQPGRHLVREGEFAYEFFVIEEGTAEVRRGDQYLDELGPGDFFGEMGLIGDTTRNASVIATTPLTAVVMTGSAFRQIDRELPDIARKIRKEIEARCHHLEALG